MEAFWQGIVRTLSRTHDANRANLQIDAIILQRDSHRGEPDALTAHVRFWEGAVPNWIRLKYCDTTTGNQVATGNTNLNLKPRGTALLTRSGVALASFVTNYEFNPTCRPVILVVMCQSSHVRFICNTERR